jgi:hypothetical protein
MAAKTQPQHRAEPNEATLKFWRDEENLHRTHGVKPVILPGFGWHRKTDTTEEQEQAA